MLTSSGNQYLRPEYLTPLPTTLDAKKSPLALLAQTCSQIGADTPNNKPIIPPIEKKKPDTSKEKSSPSGTGSLDKSSFKTYDSSKKDVDVGNMDERNGFKSPQSKGATPSSPHSASPVVSATSGSKSPSVQSSTEPKSLESTSKSTESTVVTSSVQSPLTSSSSSSVSALSLTNKLNFASLLAPHELAVKDMPLGTFKPTLPGFGYPTCLSGYVSVDGVSTAPTLPSSLATQSPLSQKPGLFPPSSLSGLNPYVGYARIKTAAGTETLVPVCRDPYCTGCQLSIQNAHMLNSSCPNGCAQCDHQKNGLHALTLGLNSGNPITLYPPHNNVPGGPRPYVCNWIQGEAYCGKRFSSSEELLQHLRTHTNLSSSDSSTLSVLNPLAPHPFLTNSGLHRTYPTPPLSPLSAGRYHPYSKFPLGGSLPTLPSSLTNSGLSVLPPYPLSAYYPAYAFYGQRLGAAAGLHP